ncbi:hypothetical protein ig2599ANME_2233 [groundwater metagenome]
MSEVYGWIITRDVLFEKGDHREWETDATGTMGGHNTTFTKEEIKKGVEPQANLTESPKIQK